MLKRGGFAKDNRTGQIVRVKEIGGTDVMIRTAYKSDAYWVQKTDLVPVPDPHAWKGGELAKFLLLLVFMAGVGWGGWAALDGVDDAWARGVYGIFLPDVLWASVGARWLGLVRD
jgi:hypothetical protein